jgi:hypothetical protein
MLELLVVREFPPRLLLALRGAERLPEDLAAAPDDLDELLREAEAFPVLRLDLPAEVPRDDADSLPAVEADLPAFDEAPGDLRAVLDADCDFPAVLRLADALLVEPERLVVAGLRADAALLRAVDFAPALRLLLPDLDAAVLRPPVELLAEVAPLAVERDALGRFAVPALFAEAVPVFFAVGLVADALRLFVDEAGFAREEELADLPAAEDPLRDLAAVRGVPLLFEVPLLFDAAPVDFVAPERLLAAEVVRPEADFVELDAAFPDFATAFLSLSSSEQSQSALLEERLFRVELPFFEA